MIGKAAQVASKSNPYVIGGVILVGGAIVYFGILRPILCKVGIANCRAGRLSDRTEMNMMVSGGFNPDYWETHNPTINFNRARVLAEKIYNAGGTFNDNESDFYSVLQEAGSMANLSVISKYFASRWGSLSEHVAYYLDSDAERKKVDKILRNYPDWRQSFK